MPAVPGAGKMPAVPGIFENAIHSSPIVNFALQEVQSPGKNSALDLCFMPFAVYTESLYSFQVLQAFYVSHPEKNGVGSEYI